MVFFFFFGSTVVGDICFSALLEYSDLYGTEEVQGRASFKNVFLGKFRLTTAGTCGQSRPAQPEDEGFDGCRAATGGTTLSVLFFEIFCFLY